jgi:hypothetical protein
MTGLACTSSEYFGQEGAFVAIGNSGSARVGVSAGVSVGGRSGVIRIQSVAWEDAGADGGVFFQSS